MLQRLGRWLRAAGHDVAIASPGQGDAEILSRALLEGRLLITRDRGLLERRGAEGKVLLLEANSLPDLVAELTTRLHIDWLYRPFSRCLECNTPLVVAPDEVKGRVPPESLREGETLLYCPRCGKAYWNGSHVKRMQRQLECFSLGVWQGCAEGLPGENKQ